MRERGRAWDQQDIRCSLEQPGQRNLRRRPADPRADCIERVRLERREAAEREIWHIGHTQLGELLDERIVRAMSEIVVVLHTYDLGDAACFLELTRRYGADAEMSDEALALQLC